MIECYGILDGEKSLFLDTIRKDKYESWDYVTRKERATVEFLRRKKGYSCKRLIVREIFYCNEKE